MVAVEPSEGMREELVRAVPAAEVLDGTAESIPLDDGSVDAVVVGQAFHWFDGVRALAEIARVLTPGGGLGLVWNVREPSADWVVRLGELYEPYRHDVPTYRGGEWKAAFESTTLFGPLRHRSHPYVHDTDAPTMVERIASISWIAALPEAERAALLDRVRALLDELPDRFPVPYRTDVWWCRATPGLRGPNATPGLRGPNATPGLRGPNATTGLRGPNATTGLRGPNASAGLRGPNASAGSVGP